MGAKQIIRGKIVSGLKQGAYFTQLDWVQRQCTVHLGYGPYPGTLNIEVAEESRPAARALLKADGMELLPPDTNFCTGKLFPVTIAGIEAAIVIPATAVRSHSGNIVEVIAPVNLKATLRLTNGDPITVVLGGCGGGRPSR